MQLMVRTRERAGGRLGDESTKEPFQARQTVEALLASGAQLFIQHQSTTTAMEPDVDLQPGELRGRLRMAAS